MAFKALFLAHAPDGEAEKYRYVIETPRYYVCKKAVKEEGVQSILLCPGFTHRDVAEISEAVGENVGIFVARGDGPSNKISMGVMTSEGWFSEKGKE